jgi:benzylsuccinate CoA-transferase BbsF subunit
MVDGASPRSPGPLTGLRILELTHVWAGPVCGQILSDLGAEVIRLESRRRIDVHRTGGPYPNNEPGINRSGVWNSQNRGKLSCTLNIATPRGLELARRLVARCDGVIENFSPGTLERLGLGFDALRAVQPDLVLVSLSAYGQTGPQRAYSGYGPMMDAACGIMAMTEYGDGIPRAANGWAADIGGALTGAVEMLAALLMKPPGHAHWADVSEYEAAALFQLEGMLAWSGRHEDGRPHGNLGPGGEFTECFASRGEDSWVAVSASTQVELDALAGLVGVAAPSRAAPGLQPPIAAYRPLLEATTRWTAERERSAAIDLLHRAGVPCGPVSDQADVVADPVLQSSGAFVETDHAEVGRLRTYGPVWQFRERAVGSTRAAPCLGQDNRYVFGELLSLDDATIGELERQQVIY